MNSSKTRAYNKYNTKQNNTQRSRVDLWDIPQPLLNNTLMDRFNVGFKQFTPWCSLVWRINLQLYMISS